MQLASSARIPDGFMAAMRLGGEKPHQGLPGRNPALYQGPTVCNSTTALGLQAAAVLNRVGSCSTGKEHDQESGNDYFGARYYASSMGRFMSPDWSAKVMPVPYATMGDPQSLNLYAYVQNNPLSRIDADGHKGRCGGPGQPACTCADVEVKAKTTSDPKYIKTNPIDRKGTILAGVAGEVTYTVKVDKKTPSEIQAHESNNITEKENGVPKPVQVYQTTNNSDNGKIPDTVGPVMPSTGTASDLKNVDNEYSANKWEMTAQHSMSLIISGPNISGTLTCNTYSINTVTNIGSNGSLQPNYSLTPTQPVVSAP